MFASANQNSGNTCESYWKQLPSGFKYFGIIIAIFGLAGLFTPVFAQLFANYIFFTINKFQIWRLITSFLIDISIISVIFKLYMLSFSLPDIEKTYSTTFVLLQIIIHTVICNATFIILGEFLQLFQVVDKSALISYGIVHLVFIFLWQRVASNPQQNTRFCFFPCLMPQKYLPWCFLAFYVLFSMDFYALIGCLLGFLQYSILKRSFIQLPMSFYKKVEHCIPISFRNASSFIQISGVQAKLRSVCRKPKSSSSEERRQNNPFNSNNQAIDDRVQAVGKAVTIGSSSPIKQSTTKNFKNHWIKESDEQVQKKNQFLEQNRQNMNINDTIMSEHPLTNQREQ